jgi:hypothetical protein
MSRGVNASVLALAGVVFAVAAVVPLWLVPIVVFVLLFGGAALIEHLLLEDDDDD